MAMVGPVIKVLSKIPWKDVLKFGPAILEAASGLFARNTSPHSKQETLESRVARLESNEKEQAELIQKMAERQEFLLRTAQVLDTRIKLLFGLSIALLIALVFALLRLRGA
jgi:CBS domain containing-hemolysin-like protein